MKKFILFLLLVPMMASAAVSQNLYYGLKQNSGVAELQRYLIAKGFLPAGNDSGNFFSLTRTAVKKFQASKKISATGYVGQLTRQVINTDLSTVNTVSSATTNKTVPAVVISTTPITASPLTGAFDLVQSSYAGQTVIAPQNNFKLADFSLTNNTNEPINLKTAEIDFIVNSNSYSINNPYLSNLYIKYGNNKTPVLLAVYDKNHIPINSLLPIGQSLDISVYADIDSAVPLNSIINAGILVSGITSVSSTSVTTNSNTVFSGQNMNFGTSSFTVGQDSSTPASQIVTGGQQVIVGAFKLSSVGDAYTVSELKFIIPSSQVPSVLSGAVLSDGNTKIALSPVAISPTSVNTNYVLDFGVNIPIPINSSKTVTLSYNLNQKVNATNTNVSPVLVYVKASNSSGILIDGVATNYNIRSLNGGVALPAEGVTVNGLSVFNGIPKFSTVSSSVVAPSGVLNLYTFGISADPKGDVYIKQLTFMVNITSSANGNSSVNNFTLLKGTADYSNSVEVGYIVNGNDISLKSNGSALFLPTNTVVLTFAQPEKISAGKTQTYTIQAHAVNPTAGSSVTVSTSLLSDTVSLTGGQCLSSTYGNVYFGLWQYAINNPLAPIYNVLWSDSSSNSGICNWYNGFGLLGLPLASQSSNG